MTRPFRIVTHRMAGRAVNPTPPDKIRDAPCR